MRKWKKYTDPIICVLLVAFFIGLWIKYSNAKYKEELFEAIKNNDIEKIDSSLDSDRILTIKDKYDNSVLHLAVIDGQAEIVKSLLIRKNWEFTYNYRGHTPIHIAAMLGEAEIFKDLMLVTDVDTKTLDGNLPLHLIPLGYTYRPKEIPEGSLTDGHIEIARLSSRDDWIIDGVKCQYVYFDEAGNQRTPPDRDFEPGEFEELYKALPTIEYVFNNGMSPVDPLIMDRVVQAIREKTPDYDLKIDSINARGLAPSIKFTVQQKEQQDEALKAITEQYENKINMLETDKDRLYELLAKAIDSPKSLTVGGDMIGNAIGDDSSVTTGNITIHKDNVNKSSLDEGTKAIMSQAIEAVKEQGLSEAKACAVLENIDELRKELEKPKKDSGVIKKLFEEINVFAAPVASVLSTISCIGKMVGM
ncbi:MAG: ankyrin repeat domain-containing protein [Phycisphaerae bacterium]|nr:ankyrin repeat domain-containing protein [Phycisphaerae bacterium]